MTAGDRVMRAITFDGGFRVITCRTTELVQRAIELQKVDGADARAFGELMTGAILVRETMSPSHRVQAILTSPGRGSMVADSRPPDDDDVAATRGLVSRHATSDGAPMLGDGAILKAIRSLPHGRIHQSIVEARAGGMAEALMSYMQESEQVFATLGVATVVEHGRVVASGGFVVQLLPELADGPLAVMTERLAHDFAHLDPLLMAHDGDEPGLARWLLDELLHGMRHETLCDQALTFACDCSMARVLTALATLGRDELTSMVVKGEVLELNCDYCTAPYRVGAEQLRSLLEPA